jgi:hypothetical protein
MTTIEPEGNNLTRKQREAIPFLIGARSIEEGRKLAKVGQRTIHRWLKEPAFKNAVEHARETFVTEALDRLRSSVSRAVSTLSDTMVEGEPALKVRAASLILEYFFKTREIMELESRVRRIEEALDAEKVRH